MRYLVVVILDNKIEDFKHFTNYLEASIEYVKLAKEWYSNEGLNDFRSTSNYVYGTKSFYKNYFESESYLDACDRANIEIIDLTLNTLKWNREGELKDV